MKFSLFSLTAFAGAVLAQNASQPQINFCQVTTLDQYVNLAPTCAHYCERLALGSDGCAPDDFLCHCANAWEVAVIIQDCIFNPAYSNCTTAEVDQFGAIYYGLCGFWNSTAANASASAFACGAGGCAASTSTQTATVTLPVTVTQVATTTATMYPNYNARWGYRGGWKYYNNN